MIRKVILSLLILIGFIGNNFAQNFEWVNQISGSSADRGRAVCTNSQNEVIVSGYYSGTIDFDPGPGINSLTSTGGSSVFVAKYDENGSLIWVIHFDGTGGGAGYSCSVDNQDNILVTGNFGGTLDFDPGPTLNNLSSIGGVDFYVAKLTTNGNLIWVHSFGTSTVEECYTITTDANNNIYLGGYTAGNLDLDPGPGIFNLNVGGFISSLNPNGNFRWAAKFSSSEVRSLKTSESNLYSTGHFNGTVDFNPGAGTLNLTGSNDLFLLKLDTLSNFDWAYSLDGFDALAIETDNNSVYFTGSFGGTLDFDPGPSVYNLTANASTAAMYILKLDEFGNFQFAKCFTGSGSCTGIGINLDNNKNIYTTGIFYNTVDFDPNIGIENLSSNGNEEIFISKLDSTGNSVWNKSIGGSGWDAGYGIAVNGNNSVFVTGSFSNTVDFDPDAPVLNLTAQGSYDGYLLKIAQANCSNLTLTIDSATNSLCSTSGYISCEVFNATLPVSYSWDTSPTSSSNSASPILGGIYTVTILDSNNCMAQRSVLVNGPEYSSNFDLNVNLHAETMQSGGNSDVWLDGFNDGCLPTSGSLSLILDTSLALNSSLPVPDHIYGDTLVWDFINLIYDSTHITPILNVTINALLNDSIFLTVLISPLSGDIDSSNNVKTYFFPVIGSYDPNFKQVYPQGECIPNYVLNNEPLTYTIHFQNTGNADAINIHLLDTLDPNLDLNTLRVIGNSHYVITEILPGNVMNFRFDNIHLPDSTSDEPNSHGYVIYEVYPNSFASPNTLIENTAHIYFDFNPAIVTNTTQNTLVDSIPTSYSTAETVSVCYNSDYTLPDGTLFTNITSNISYQSNLWMVDGCDSIITTNISVLPIIDTTTSLNNFTITANTSGSTYQWMDCNSGLPIIGENSQSFTPIANGNYAVIINDGNCSDTSACISITTLETNNFDLNSLVKIYPNPANDHIFIELPEEMVFSEINITDLQGKIVQSLNGNTKLNRVDISNLSEGMYFIQVNSEIGNVTYKFIKE